MVGLAWLGIRSLLPLGLGLGLGPSTSLGFLSFSSARILRNLPCRLVCDLSLLVGACTVLLVVILVVILVVVLLVVVVVVEVFLLLVLVLVFGRGLFF